MQKEKLFHLKKALSLVSIDFHTLRYLVTGLMWINVCHAIDFKIVVRAGPYLQRVCGVSHPQA